jgi:hypothetical protein
MLLVFETQTLERAYSSDHELSVAPLLLDAEVATAFSTLLSTPEMFETHRFCFFVDALDEYQQTNQKDYGDLMTVLQGWTAGPGDAIKICVSSRENNLFENALHPINSMRLQLLTRSDMLRYANDKLLGLESSVDRLRVSKTIVEKSSGIFLWAALVVKSLRERLEEGTKLSDFEKELDFLPTKLEKLYDHLLDEILPSRRCRAFQVFAMIAELERTEAKLPLISCSFMDAYDQDSQFALRQSSARRSKISQAIDDKQDTIELLKSQTRRMIRGSCRSLVEVREDDDDRGDAKFIQRDACRTCVVYVHRTVPEFLQKESTRESSRQHLRGFNVASAISHILLETLRSIGADIVHRERWARLNFAIVATRTQARLDQWPSEYLSHLEAATREKITPLDLPERFHIRRLYRPNSVATFVLNPYEPGELLPIRSAQNCFFFVASPLYLAAGCGSPEYVAWHLATGMQPSQQTSNGTMLLACLFSSISRPWALTRHLSDTDKLLDCVGMITKSPYGISSVQLVAQLAQQMVSIRSPTPLSAISTQSIGRLMARIIETVRHVDTPSIELRAETRAMSSGEEYIVYWMVANSVSRCFEERMAGSWNDTPGFRFIKSYSEKPIPLRTLVKFSQFKNEAEILQLLDDLEKPKEVKGVVAPVERKLLSEPINTTSDTSTVHSTTLEHCREESVQQERKHSRACAAILFTFFGAVGKSIIVAFAMKLPRYH